MNSEASDRSQRVYDVAFGRRASWRVRLVSLAVVLGVAAFAAPSALALSQRGHAFAFSFGEAGTGDGQLSKPASVAVNETTGEVYVSDTANNRIDQFEPVRDGEGAIAGYEFKRAWGWGVADGKAKYETCESECKKGVKGAKFFDSPGQIAVDNSTDSSDPSRGNVYAIANHSDEKGLVYELGPDGEPVSTTERHGPEGAPAGRPLPAGQAPMALGTFEEEVKPGKWKRNEEETKEIARGLEVIEGVAVDANGLVWIFGEDDEFKSVTPRGALAEYEPRVEASALTVAETPGRAGIAVSTVALGAKGSVTQDHLYFRYEAEGEATEGREPKHGYCTAEPCRVAEIDAFDVEEDEAEHIGRDEVQEEGEVVNPELGGVGASGVGADPVDGDVYVDRGAAVAALDSTGAAIESFGGPEGAFAGLSEGGAVAVDHAGGPEVGEVYAIDRASGQIDVFAPAPAGPPSVDAIGVREVTSDSAQLDAQIDPGGAKSAYTVQYSTSACGEGPSACAEHFSCTSGPASCGELPSPPGQLAAGFGDQQVVVSLAGLAPGSTYHYRFVASNDAGGERHVAVSGEAAFATPPAQCECVADGRLWEMVSPPAKGGAFVEALTSEGGAIQAAADGQAFAYVTNAPIGEAEGSRSFELTQMLAARGEEGWSSRDLVTPNDRGTGLETQFPPEYRLFSSDLSLALVEPFDGNGPLAEPPLSPPASAEEAGRQENTLYERADAPIPAEGGAQAESAADYKAARANGDPGYLALVTKADELPPGEGRGEEPFGQALEFLDATPDLTHVVFSSEAPLGPGAATGEGGNLYEWSAAGGLRLVNVLPGGAPAEKAHLGAGSQIVRDAISGDGSRVFWSTHVQKGDWHLFMSDMRDPVSEQTTELDELQGGSGQGVDNPVFQAASADGSVVFFTDEQDLTPGAGAAEGRPDLYAYDTATGKLTDLTAPGGGGAEHADVQGLALGAAEDASAVYFVANGVLSHCKNAHGEAVPCRNAQGEELAPGHCSRRESPIVSGASCNLYLARYDGEAGDPHWEEPRFIARLSNEDEPDWEGPEVADNLAQLTSRVSPNGRYLAFMSDRPLTGYDNRATSPAANGAAAQEVFLYDAQSGALVCASCDPSGAPPAAVFDPLGLGENPEGLGLLVDRSRVWEGKWLAGSVPGWTQLAHRSSLADYQSRYLSNSGRLYFDSPEPLVPQDRNGKEDVYEYESEGVPHGRHECASASPTFAAASGGCVGLISSGTSDRESAFLDASETGGEGADGEELSEGGGDVFFVTAAPLSPQDTDSADDVYDAHECTSASPCIVPGEEKLPTVCEASQACAPYTAPAVFPPGSPASASTGPSGNLAPKQGVLPSKSSAKPTPKSLTRAQKLAKALKSCRAKKHPRGKRIACEKQARKEYRAKQATGHRAKNSDAHGARRLGGAR